MKTKIKQMYISFLLWILHHGQTGHSYDITSYFLEGDLVLTWPNIYHDVGITCDGNFRGFSRVDSTRFVVSSALYCNVIGVIVRGTIDYRHVEKHKTFYLKLKVATEGETVTMSFRTLQSRNYTNKYVFRINNNTGSIISSAENLSDTNMLKLPHVTPFDAGYYNLGTNEGEARGSNGIVLVIKAVPSVPVISGKLKVPRGETTSLKCNSISRSRPHFYTKFPTIVYTWFVNESEIKYNTQTLELPIHNLTLVKCQSTEGLLSTSASDYIEPLYGPERVEMTPSFHQTLTVQEGVEFSLVKCKADCNPPCYIQWKEITRDGKINHLTNATILPSQVLNARVSGYRCVATGFHANSYGENSSYRDVYFNIQYGPKTMDMTPSFNQTISIQDGESFGPVNCTADCNPPCNFQWKEITLDGVVYDVINDSNLPRQVVHAGVSGYRCVAYGSHENSRNANYLSSEISLNVQCTPRLDESVKFRWDYQVNINDNVTVLIPVIAYPMPQNLVWIGGPLVAPMYIIEGRITPRGKINSVSNSYQFFVKCDIPIINESLFGNFTLYADGVEIVTITILPKEPVKTFSMWNLSSIRNFLLGGGCFGVFCLSCLFYHAMRQKNKEKSRNRSAISIRRTSGGEAETYFTATISYVEDWKYESLQNPTDIKFETIHPLENGCSIKPEEVTYMNDVRMTYSSNEETHNETEDSHYEDIAEYIKSFQNPTDINLVTENTIENTCIIEPEKRKNRNDARMHYNIDGGRSSEIANCDYEELY